MIGFKENFFGREMKSLQKKQQEQKKKLEEAQQKAQQGAKKVKVKVKEWWYGKKGEAIQKPKNLINNALAQQQEQRAQAQNTYQNFAKGGLWAQELLEKRNAQQAQGTVNNLKQQFAQKKLEIKQLIKTYEEKTQVKDNTRGMSESIRNEVNEMAKKVNYGLNTKNVNNRMADWYEEQNEFLDNINWYITRLYWIILAAVTIFILVKFKLQNKKALGIIAALIIIPYSVNTIVQWFFNLNTNNCPTYIPSLGFESGGSKTCQVKRTKKVVDCVMGEWGRCSAVCNGGTQERAIDMESMYGGKPCGRLTQACNTQPCNPGQSPVPLEFKDPEESVLIEMPKKIWQNMEGRAGLTLKDENDMCQAEKKSKYKLDKFKGGLDKLRGGLDNLKQYDGNIKNQMGELGAAGAAGATGVAGAVNEFGEDMLGKVEKQFNITHRTCIGKYCR